MKDIFIVLNVKEELGVQLGPLEKYLPLSWADGMVGACPVFESKESALKAYPGSKIIEGKV
jgi:hypothetical protein